MSYLAVAAICAVASFLVCGIPFGLIITKHKAGFDVRTAGSGNIGMTNVARTAGKGAAVETFLCDMGKGVVCMLVSRLVLAGACFGGDFAATSPSGQFGLAATIIYMACVLGHVYSPYLGFHGGKGISVGFGAALPFAWPVGLGMLAVFLVMAVPSKYVSLGSVCADIALPFLCLGVGVAPANLWPILVVCACVLWAHRGNIIKLAHGEERKFSVHHEGDGQAK